MNIYLDKLDLQGFKSFPEKTVIRLHQGITAVVGPNGCGKSNIVDAIFWVLGEQRIKNLRGEVNEDLIFNGSMQLKPLGMAEVGAHFVKGDENVYMARRFFRTGESKYILNDKYCRNRDIQDALYDMQLGERKYFIFEQGSIDKLISLKPSEKRLLIEEAAGILQYLERKKETAQKLVVAEQNLDNLEILGADKESRLKELRNQVNYVRRYREFKEKREALLSTLLFRRHRGLADSFATTRTSLEKLLEKEKSLNFEITRREKESLEDEECRWKLDRELKQEQHEVYESRRRIQELRNDADKLEQRRSFLEQRIHELETLCANAVKEGESLGQEADTAAAEVADLESCLKEVREKSVAIDARLDAVKLRIKENATRNAESRDAAFRLQNELSGISNIIRDMDKRSGRLENEIEAKSAFVAELAAQLNEKEIQEAETRLNQARAREQKDSQAFRAESERLQVAGRELEKLIAEEKNASGEVRNLQSQIDKYQQVRERLNRNGQNGEKIETAGLLQEQVQAERDDHRWLENFYFEEMTAPLLKRNADALQSALPRLWLRRERRDETPAEIERDPGVLARVKDRFSVRDTQFKQALRNGVLVRSLEDGLRIFETHGVNVVTPDGVVITRDGIMVRNRERGILDVMDEIRAAQASQAEWEKVISRLGEERKTAEAELQKIQTGRGELENRLRNVRGELTGWQTRLETLKRDRDAVMKRVERTRAEIQFLKAEKRALETEFVAREASQKALDDQMEEMRRTLDSATDTEKETVAESARVEKELLQSEGRVNLLAEQLRSHQADLRRLQEAGRNLEARRSAHEEECRNLKQELSSSGEKVVTLRREADELEGKREKREKAIREQEGRFQELSGRLRERTRELEALRTELEEVRNKRGALEIEVSSLKKDTARLQDIAFQELNTDLESLVPGEEWQDLDLGQLQEESDQSNLRLTKMRDSNRLNFSAESEYEILSKEYGFLISQKEDVMKSINDLNEAIRRIDAESRQSFMEAFEKIRGYFLKNFQILFEGGDAEMALTDPDDILESGLEIQAQPPGKKLQSLRLLSGGEKTLTSLAFLFALFEYKPSPFCVFDEVDASLDEANIQRFLKFLHKLKAQTQFLIITHNFKTMEEADYIYGISMNEPGVSSVFSMRMTGRGGLQVADRPE
ncbi:MAG TPA: chromosome segregation protein SMC [Candidatus Aminicenantes bacterium]|nr:chromosome segregation protein SMC [Candidatus Aminicenantes bacterium]